MKNIELRNRILLCIQASLLGNICSLMLAVLCKWDEHKITVLFVLSDELDDETLNDMSNVEAELYSHFESLQIETKSISRQDAIIEDLYDYTWVFRSKSF